MPQESEALLRRVKAWKRITLGTFHGYHFNQSGWDCLLVQCGIGLKRATDATRTLLATTHPQFLACFGIAGAVNDDLQIGDVILADHTCLLEQGLAEQLQPLARISDTAWQAASQALQVRGAHLLSGTAITTRGSQAVKLQGKVLANPILEMETFGVARVAIEKGLPLLSIRSISDGPQSPIPFDLDAMMDEQYNLRIGKILAAILRQPKIIFEFKHLIQNSRKAADHAAIALLAILSQASPITG
jgi:adenosylhomocysteine nucleosidase